MRLSTYKLTVRNNEGYALLTYQDSDLNSILLQFKPVLKAEQLNYLLSRIPNHQEYLDGAFSKGIRDGVISIDRHHDSGKADDYPVNEKIALWCRFYEAHAGVKYKTGAAEAGKLKALAVSPDELEALFTAYFSSTLWWSLPKSVSGFVKKYNEIRQLAFGKAIVPEKTHPLPYDHEYARKLDFNGQRSYWKYLRDNGYRSEQVPAGGITWVKKG